jgi:hypothetical protein
MMMRIGRPLALAFAAGATFTSVAIAQQVVVPGTFAGTAGVAGLNTFIRDLGNPRTGQLLMDASELATIPPGSQITGIEFRLWTGATAPFPVSDATWANYTINMGTCVQPSLGTTTFASNFVGAPVQVRTGSLTVPAGTYSNVGGPPRPYGPVITFTTPFVYTGGHLGIEIRHPGSNITNPAASSHFLDVAQATETANRSFTAVGEAATVGAAATYTISRLTYIPGGPTGACCRTSGATNCVITSSSGCTTQGGTYQGDGTTCPNANCPPLPTGACCFTFAPCQVLTQNACTTGGGTYSGNNITCAAAACVQGWVETGDAGQLPGTAQAPSGSGSLPGIQGTLTANDVDMYQINICNEANFSASLVNGTTFDTQLFLFTTAGIGVAFDDDTAVLQSALTSTFVTANGNFLIAVAGYDNDAVDAGALELWIDTPFNVERAPDGPGAANPVASWSGAGASGPYTLTLTGTCYPSSNTCYANCDGSTGTPKLTANDFTCFINAFANGLSYANCDGSTSNPTLTANDFTCFVNAYALGCP